MRAYMLAVRLKATIVAPRRSTNARIARIYTSTTEIAIRKGGSQVREPAPRELGMMGSGELGGKIRLSRQVTLWFVLAISHTHCQNETGKQELHGVGILQMVHPSLGYISVSQVI